MNITINTTEAERNKMILTLASMDTSINIADIYEAIEKRTCIDKGFIKIKAVTDVEFEIEIKTKVLFWLLKMSKRLYKLFDIFTDFFRDSYEEFAEIVYEDGYCCYSDTDSIKDQVKENEDEDTTLDEELYNEIKVD